MGEEGNTLDSRAVAIRDQQQRTRISKLEAVLEEAQQRAEAAEQKLQELEAYKSTPSLAKALMAANTSNKQLREGIQHTLDNWDGTADKKMYQALKQLLEPRDD